MLTNFYRTVVQCEAIHLHVHVVCAISFSRRYLKQASLLLYGSLVSLDASWAWIPVAGWSFPFWGSEKLMSRVLLSLQAFQWEVRRKCCRNGWASRRASPEAMRALAVSSTALAGRSESRTPCSRCAEAVGFSGVGFRCAMGNVRWQPP